MYELEYAEGVADDLRTLRAHERKRVLDTMEEQLTYEPLRETRNRKPLLGLKPPWDQDEPVWELRIGTSSVLRGRRDGTARNYSRGPAKIAPSNDRGNPMRTVGIQAANLKACIEEAQRESIVITRNGKPVALLIGVEGMDLEQVELGHSDKFWALIRQRRRQKSLSREELEKRMADR